MSMSVTNSLQVKRALKSGVSKRSGAVAGVVAKIVLDEGAILEKLGMKGMTYPNVIKAISEYEPEKTRYTLRDLLLVLVLHEAGLIG
jgi:hypothetical protein